MASKSDVPVIIFDLGKVLVDFDYTLAVAQLTYHGSASSDAIQQLLLQGSLFLDYERGHLSTAEFFRRVKTISGFRGDLAAFRDIIGGVFTPIVPMVQLHAQVWRLGLAAYVFSNTSELVVEYLAQRLPFYRDFTGYALSFEHGFLKPDRRFYEVVEHLTQRQGADLIYIDDRPENIEMGRQLGWRTVWHENPALSRTQLARLMNQAGIALEPF